MPAGRRSSRTRSRAGIEAGHTRLVLDLSGVDFVDSSGLGAIVACLKRLGPRGDLAIAGARGAVSRLFTLTRMDTGLPPARHRRRRRGEDVLADAAPARGRHQRSGGNPDTRPDRETGAMSVGMRLHIDSDFDKVALLARAVRALCAELLDADAADAVEISLVEAVNNVIEHGYEGKPGRDVGVEVSVQPDRIVIEVVDHALPMKSDAAGSRPGRDRSFDETNSTRCPRAAWGSPSSR